MVLYKLYVQINLTGIIIYKNNFLLEEKNNNFHNYDKIICSFLNCSVFKDIFIQLTNKRMVEKVISTSDVIINLFFY